jgi:peptide chain release factor 1
VEDVDVDLNMDDVEITSTFASGPGGQHMQKNATAIRVVHKPTGMQVNVQSERSQTQNRRVALAILQGRLQEIEEQKQHAERAADRRSQVGTGDRSEKIRTYNYPQSRVTDHRVGYSSYNLTAVMDGELDPFIERLTIADQTEKLAAVSEE